MTKKHISVILKELIVAGIKFPGNYFSRELIREILGKFAKTRDILFPRNMQSRHSRKLIPAKISKNRKSLYRKPHFLINNTENWSLVSFLLVEVT